MNIQSTTSNYFKTAHHVGVRQKVERRTPLSLPGGLVLWKAVGKILVWGLPVVLALNLWCASRINTRNVEISETSTALQQLKTSNAALQTKVDRLVSPVRVKIAAAEKLKLYEPAPGQIQRM